MNKEETKKLATVICSKTGTGISSKTIIAYCTGVEYFDAGRPYDASDVRRCLNVLQFFPEWKEKIKNIDERFPCWGAIGRNWEKVEVAYNNGDDCRKLLSELSKSITKKEKGKTK